MTSPDQAREPGFYWIRCDREGGWQPGQWVLKEWAEESGAWYLCRHDLCFWPEEIDEVGDRLQLDEVSA